MPRGSVPPPQRSAPCRARAERSPAPRAAPVPAPDRGEIRERQHHQPARQHRQDQHGQHVHPRVQPHHHHARRIGQHAGAGQQIARKAPDCAPPAIITTIPTRPASAAARVARSSRSARNTRPASAATKGGGGEDHEEVRNRREPEREDVHHHPEAVERDEGRARRPDRGQTRRRADPLAPPQHGPERERREKPRPAAAVKASVPSSRVMRPEVESTADPRMRMSSPDRAKMSARATGAASCPDRSGVGHLAAADQLLADHLLGDLAIGRFRHRLPEDDVAGPLVARDPPSSQPRSPSASSRAPGAGTQTARPTSPQVASGTPRTATSATAGLRRICSSISRG